MHKIKNIAVFFVYLAFMISQNSALLQNDTTVIELINERSKWFEHIPMLPVVFGASKSIQNVRCKEQTKLYMENLDKFKLWAFKMFDSSTKFPSGIAGGQLFDIGNFDECTRIKNVHIKNNIIQGKYCLVKVQYGLQNASWLEQDPYLFDFDLQKSAWEKLQYRGDVTKYRRDILTWAMCIPSACSPSDVESTLAKELQPFLNTEGIDIRITVPSSGCTTSDDQQPFPYIVLSFWSVFIALIIICVVATVREDKFEIDGILQCFSFKKNIKSLISFKPMHRGLDIMHAAKFGLMLLVVGAHIGLKYHGHPLTDATALDATYRSMFAVVLHCGWVAVDAFFVISAAIMSYNLLNQLDKRPVNLISHIFLRYARLTPTYMLVVFFIATSFYYTGSGPFWNKYVGLEQTRCSTNWWTSLLYIQNYYDSGNMCMFPSWYIATDFHLFIIGTILIFIYSWKYTVGLFALSISILISIIIPFVEILVNKAAPLYIYLPEADDVRNDAYFLKYYVQTQYRAMPYLIGLLTGILFHKVKSEQHIPKSYKPKVISMVIFTICIIWLFGCMMSGYPFIIPGKKYTALEAATYNIFHRIAVAIGTVCVFCIHAYGNMGFLYRLFIIKPLVVLGRLTFGVYIAHILPHLYTIGTQRAPKYFSFYTFVESLTTDVVLSFLLAFILTLLVELPTRNLTNLYFRKK